jgi:hypothetical protein
VFFHWKTLNRRFDICASNKFLSHASLEINDGRDFISFPWSLSQVQMAFDRWMKGVLKTRKYITYMSFIFFSSYLVPHILLTAHILPTYSTGEVSSSIQLTFNF